MNPCFWQFCLPQHFLSKIYGALARIETPRIKNAFIRKFMRDYGVSLEEACQQSPEAFKHFNDFFTRALKPECRPIDADDNSVISPVDGTLSDFGTIEDNRLIQAKKHPYTLQALLADDSKGQSPYRNGQFATLYLAPHNYHRIHMPIDGTLTKFSYIPGKLFSVNLKTAEHIPGLFAKNERVVLEFETEHGPMALVLVGAMIVASMSTVFGGLVEPHGSYIVRRNYSTTKEHHIHLKKGEEVGRFLLGSTVVMVFGPDCMQWLNSVESGQPVVMGRPLAALI